MTILLLYPRTDDEYQWTVPDSLPLPPVPVDNLMSTAKVELGRHLFYDARLSGDGTVACASCHDRGRAFTDGRQVAVGIHGTHGKLNIADLRFTHPVSRAFIEAGVQAGHPATDDFNNDVQEGMGMYKVNQKDGERCGVSRAYLHPVMDRPNLTIMTDALVNRVLFEGKRAIGVEVEHKGQIRTLKADNEVILSGGAINSPQILKLSGVGPAAELAEHNIPLVHDLPGVGENLQDHPDALVVHKSLRKDTLSLAPGALLTTGLKGFIDFF